jgi:hypothetical protein
LRAVIPAIIPIREIILTGDDTAAGARGLHATGRVRQVKRKLAQLLSALFCASLRYE